MKENKKSYRDSFHSLVECVVKSLTQLEEIQLITQKLCVELRDLPTPRERDCLHQMMIVDERLLKVEALLTERLPSPKATRNRAEVVVETSASLGLGRGVVVSDDVSCLRSSLNLGVDGPDDRSKKTAALTLKDDTASSAAAPAKILTQPKRFVCHYCSQAFTQNKYLQQHVACRHEGVLNECRLCGKTFASRNNLNVHMATHAERRAQFRCPVCDKVYLYKSHLNKHHKIEHLHQRFQCSLCKKEMRTRANLAQHVKIHEGVTYDCPECPATFSQKSGLLYHKKSKHSRLVPFKCETCDRTFVLRSKLTDHQRRCHQSKSVVGSGFRTRVSSHNHMKLYDVKRPVGGKSERRRFRVFKSKNAEEGKTEEALTHSTVVLGENPSSSSSKPPAPPLPSADTVSPAANLDIGGHALPLNLDLNNILPLSIEGTANLAAAHPDEGFCLDLPPNASFGAVPLGLDVETAGPSVDGVLQPMMPIGVVSGGERKELLTELTLPSCPI